MLVNLEPSFPEYLNVETTNKCNLKCIMCPRDTMTRAEGTMDMDLYRKIVEDCIPYVEHVRVFSLFMDGEPLLDDLLEERIRIAKNAGIRFIDIATNGMLLTRSRARSLVESGLDSIIISLDDIDGHVHEHIRRGCDYKRVISNLEGLLSIRDKAGSTRPEITVRMLDVGENASHREAFLEYWKAKVERITVVPAHNWGGAVRFGQEVRKPNTECTYLWREIVILVDGTVPLCCLDYDRVHKLGDVRYESIYDIWHGAKFKEYRQRFENSQIDLCNNCNWVPGSVIEDTIHGKEREKEGADGQVKQHDKEPDGNVLEMGCCIVCGHKASFRFDDGIITPQLRNAWGITDEMARAFNYRESQVCSFCGSSLRVRRLCAAIIQTFSEMSGRAYNSFADLLGDERFRCLRIAEINACGDLHNYLEQHPNLSYSEYVPGAPCGSEQNGIRCEDLQRLTYPDDYFDIILTSDTLEHVPDPDKAWSEIHRTLKSGGYHIFTIPVVPSQPTTRQRARPSGRGVEYLTKPAYHGGEWGAEDELVYTDFAMDVVDVLNKLGLSTEVLYYEQGSKDVAFVFRSLKQRVSDVENMEAAKLEWTGERFLPWIEGAQIHYEHLHRYAFAAHFVKGKKVLDLACGEGYGTYMLAREADYVAGVDVDEQTVRHAASRYLQDNLEFIQGSILNIPIEGEHKFDVAVCFEGIEHVAEHEKLLSEVKRLLRPDGVFIVSTPNKAVYTDAPDYHNPFHLKELYVDEFKGLLRRNFAHVRMFGQRIYAGSNMWSIHKHKTRGYVESVIKKGDGEFYFTESRGKEPVYLIALASDTSLDPSIAVTDSWLTDASNAFFNDYERRLGELNHAVQTRAAEMSSLEASLGDKTSRIAELEASLGDKTSRIAELEASLGDKTSRIAELEASLQGQASRLADLETGLREKKSLIAGLEAGLEKKAAHVTELETSHYQKELQIQGLEFQLQQIGYSIPMQLVSRYQGVVEKLLRAGSRRRRYYELGLSAVRIILNEGWGSFRFKFRTWRRQRRAERRRAVIAAMPQDAGDDWSAYWVLSRRIAEARQRRLESYKPKPPRMISIDEDKVITHARSLRFPPVRNPQVSIVIPVYNNDKLTIECLSSLLTHRNDISYEVIIIDDGSARKTEEVLSQVENITYLRNPQNLGFLLSCNRAAEKARGTFLLILNNDVQFTEGWLSALVETFSHYENVGAVSPKILYPNGRLQEAGARIKQDAYSQLIGLWDDPELPRYSYTREIDYCSGVCLLMETEAFRKLGGFDTAFVPAYCEDADLCFRLRKLGKRIFCNPNSVVIHHLSATVKVDSGYKLQLAVRNAQKLAERWQEQIDDLNRVRLIAFYLPQYHPIPENDYWWGKGFTEWTNVGKARPNFAGHYQPHEPAELGFYDLRNEDVMVKQAEMARKYGIHGFCYFYYWFGGKRLLEMPLERMLQTGKPDIPFCLCWANENWTRRWDGRDDQVLIGQSHSDGDDAAVIKDLMRYMRHPSYIRVSGKPVLLVYRVGLFPNIKRTANIWRQLCRKEGIGEIYLAMCESFEHAVENVPAVEYGFDASVEYPPHQRSAPIEPPGKLTNPHYKGVVSDYREIVLRYLQKEMPGFTHFRTVMPGWDNTPRNQDSSYIFACSSPGAYQAWLEAILHLTLEQNFGDERIVFVNAWNEWAEGNHLEPDKRYGHGYLEATQYAISGYLCAHPVGGESSADHPPADNQQSLDTSPLVSSPDTDAADVLVPPIEMMFDGATSVQEFRHVGEVFTQLCLIERAKLKPDEKVLDVGCGIGQKARVLTRYLSKEGAYYGFDIVSAAIAWCREQYKPFPSFRFEFADIYNTHYNPKGKIEASEYRFPYANETFDLVFLSSVFTHMLPRDVENYFGEIARVLKRHGRCVISYFLLNPRSLRGIKAKSNTIQIPFEHGSAECRVADLNDPERTVAYDEEFIRTLYERHSLSIVDITYGSWCGRQELLSSQQDIIIAVKE